MQELKSKIAKDFQNNSNDNGSASVQIALLTSRIQGLIEHSNEHKHDYSGKRGLISLVEKRRKLLSYLRRKDNAKYQELIASLGLRR
ncbi:MAG: 30S ribosomal protein S15 [Dehalococcoidia bacterium]|nr:30S ribosomal protein S15 [Dehalococcoidia bacterium]|tara:strand:- start:1496 stop:1756 length:261 start_codon:yes stop_codon:yes gene_type:complete